MKTSSEKFYLGVEGGATKSAAILVDGGGKLLGERQGKALSWQSEGRGAAKQNMAKLLSPLLKKSKSGKIYAVFGLAGLDTKKDEAIYKKIVKSILPKDSVFCVLGDALIALEAKCPCAGNRIVIISGTGSTVVGQSNGKEARSASEGFILANEGSGYMVGLKALRAAVRFWDGRSEPTLLYDLVLKKSHTKTMEDFIPNIYKIFGDKKQSITRYIASFAIVVDEAILQHDGAALRIRDETVKELMDGVRAVVSRLKIENEKLCVGLVGSVWKMPGFKKLFTEDVRKQFSQAVFLEKEESPVWGAIALAKKLQDKRT